jgi:hypothetical protein
VALPAGDVKRQRGANQIFVLSITQSSTNVENPGSEMNLPLSFHSPVTPLYLFPAFASSDC